MNFLNLRSNSQTASSEQQKQKSDQENQTKPSTTLEGLIDEDPFPPTPSSNNAGRDLNSKFGAAFSTTSNVSGLENHVDVTEDQGWITIPYSMFHCPSKFCRCLMVILLVLCMWCFINPVY